MYKLCRNLFAILIFAISLLYSNRTDLPVEANASAESCKESENEPGKECEKRSENGKESKARKIFEVVSAGPNEQLTDLFARKNGWTGADAAYSVPLSKSRSVWLFGDTFVGRVKDKDGGHCRDPASMMINNSVACQNTGHPTAPLQFYWRKKNGKAQAIFVPREAGTWYWPGDGLTIEGKLYLFFHRIARKNNNSSAWDFAAAGDDLVLVRNPLDTPTVWRIESQPLPSFINWGNAAIADEHFIYAYGSNPTAAEGLYKHPTVLARLPLDKLQKPDFSAWQYWCEPGKWGDKADNIKVLIKDGSPEMTVSRVRGLAGYFAVYTRAGLGPDIMARHADRPEGPWSEAQKLYHCPEQRKGLFVYAAKAHPELATTDGEIIITYCCNFESFAENFKHAEIYRPRAVKVMLKHSMD